MANISQNLCLLLFLLFTVQYALESKKTLKRHQPCKRLVFFYHDKLFNGTDSANATSVAVTNVFKLGDPQYFFGRMVIFNDPITADREFHSPPVAQSHGLYFWDMKNYYNAWFAFILVFNSTEHHRTLNIMGADIIADNIRYFSVVGGMGDFFMMRGIAPITVDAFEAVLNYFRFKIDINLYECH